jgi:hypothetical protein
MQYVLVDQLMSLASTASMPQVRAVATYKLKAIAAGIGEGSGRTTSAAPARSEAQTATAVYLAAEINRFLDRPSPPAQRIAVPEAPPGAPIGQPAMDWLRRLYGECIDEIR